MDVQEAGQWEVRVGADVGGTEYKSRKGVYRVLKEEWVGEVGSVEGGAVYWVGLQGLVVGRAGGRVCVGRVYGRVGSQGGTELEIGGVVPFVDVKQVLNVNRLV